MKQSHHRGLCTLPLCSEAWDKPQLSSPGPSKPCLSSPSKEIPEGWIRTWVGSTELCPCRLHQSGFVLDFEFSGRAWRENTTRAPCVSPAATSKLRAVPKATSQPLASPCPPVPLLLLLHRPLSPTTLGSSRSQVYFGAGSASPEARPVAASWRSGSLRGSLYLFED